MIGEVGSGSPFLADFRRSTEAGKRGIWKQAALKTWEIAKLVFKTLAFCWLFWMNSTLFAGGVALGFICSDWTDKVFEKIGRVWRGQKGELCVLLVLGAVISLPVTIGVSSFLSGAYVGKSLANGIVEGGLFGGKVRRV